MGKIKMRYFIIKQETEDENRFHSVVAENNNELDELMDKYSRTFGGTWRLEREVTEAVFHKFCEMSSIQS